MSEFILISGSWPRICLNLKVQPLYQGQMVVKDRGDECIPEEETDEMALTTRLEKLYDPLLHLGAQCTLGQQCGFTQLSKDWEFLKCHCRDLSFISLE